MPTAASALELDVPTDVPRHNSWCAASGAKRRELMLSRLRAPFRLEDLSGPATIPAPIPQSPVPVKSLQEYALAADWTGGFQLPLEIPRWIGGAHHPACTHSTTPPRWFLSVSPSDLRSKESPLVAQGYRERAAAEAVMDAAGHTKLETLLKNYGRMKRQDNLCILREARQARIAEVRKAEIRKNGTRLSIRAPRAGFEPARPCGQRFSRPPRFRASRPGQTLDRKGGFPISVPS